MTDHQGRSVHKGNAGTDSIAVPQIGIERDQCEGNEVPITGVTHRAGKFRTPVSLRGDSVEPRLGRFKHYGYHT